MGAQGERRERSSHAKHTQLLYWVVVITVDALKELICLLLRMQFYTTAPKVGTGAGRSQSRAGHAQVGRKSRAALASRSPFTRKYSASRAHEMGAGRARVRFWCHPPFFFDRE